MLSGTTNLVGGLGWVGVRKMDASDELCCQTQPFGLAELHTRIASQRPRANIHSNATYIRMQLPSLAGHSR